MREITLHSRKYPGLVALVDNSDYEWLNQRRWCPTPRGRIFYAVTGNRRGYRDYGMVYMHRLIRPDLPLIDHVDNDGLNNQRDNLRLATHAENMWNSRKHLAGSSIYKGVFWDNKKSTQRKWHATILADGKNHHLGFFGSEEYAARAYDVAALQYFGEFATLNFPDSVEQSRATVASRAGRQVKTSQYLNVRYHKANRNWQARITVNGQVIHLGAFDSEIEAAIAYDRAAREHGRLGRLNFPGIQSDYILAA